jgi:drug/metabolite transporter (DMT)-like permease
MNRTHLIPILQAFAAALLFGASAPLAKLFLGQVEPVPLAAFLYLGSGLGVLGVKIFQRFRPRASEREAQIQRADLPWLAGAILAGGVAAPILLLFSLQQTPAATASLLLNFEGVATTLIAALVFREALSRRAGWAIALITLSSLLLSVNFSAAWGLSLGAAGILAACFLWGLDNNLTRNLSAKDPLSIVTLKGLGAGSFSLGMALVLGNPFPAPRVILGAMLLGSLSYGLSIVLFIHALRGLGAARTSALFGTAPLAGMLFSFLLFRELPGWLFLPALPLMALGTVFLLGEEHEHAHLHPLTFHEHAHDHADGHHDHAQAGEETEKHSHPHEHVELEHDHDHLPDLHHRHDHSSEISERKEP